MFRDLTWFIALRQLRSSRRNRYFSWISTLSVAGVAISVASLIVVLSVINGFEIELRNRFLAFNAHIMAFRFPSGIENPDRWSKEIFDLLPEEIEATSPFVHYETMAQASGLLHSVLVRGFDPRSREKVQSVGRSIEPPSALEMLNSDQKRAEGKPPPVIIGAGLAKVLGLKIHDRFALLAPDPTGNNPSQVFEIVGLFHAGIKNYDNRIVAMSLADAQAFFRMNGRVTGLEIKLKHPEKSVEVSQSLNEAFTMTFKEWQSYNHQLFQALKTERAVIILIIFLIAIVAGFNILTTLFVTVTHRQRDISILKALGAPASRIVMVFLKQGLIFGVAGAIGGCLLALVISQLIEQFQFIDLPDTYWLTHLPVTYSWSVYLGISSIGLVVCLVAGIFPAFAAARVHAIEGLRGTGRAIGS